LTIVESLAFKIYTCRLEMVKRGSLVIYISHPYRDCPDRNVDRVRLIAKGMANTHCIPVAPHLYLPQLLEEASERDLAMRLCLGLVALCDELHAYGEPTEGMRLEIAEAERLGIPVVYVERE